MSNKSAYLRSINLVYDADSPERIAHFQPTAKCVGLMQNLAGLNADRAFFVTAPYGTGKSLSATYLLHLVQNRPEATQTLEEIQKRLKPVSPEMGKFAERRLQNKDLGGIVLALEGHHADVGKALQEAAIESFVRLKMGREARPIASIDADGSNGAVEVLAALCEKAKQCKKDRVLIIWDEFGRHLERLVASGQSAKIGDIQQIAEFVSRENSLPVTFSAIMHQGLLSYAGSTSQSGLAAWRKVEGRFQTIQYVDDSKELYHLIGKLISDTRPKVEEPSAVYQADNELKEYGLLKEFSIEELEALQGNAAPLEPLTLYLLPRLAARAAQNERTLFGFLYSVDLDQTVTPAHLYDYFGPAMRSDTGVGGTYRSWLETESAISKAASELEIKALKTVCLLSLGLSGERTKATPELLEYALSASDDRKAVRKTIKVLVDRKLLLKRKHTGQISLWHGTDVDLRGRLVEELGKIGEEFDIEDFLEHEFPPPVWRPTAYNDEYQLRRYFTSQYLSPRSIKPWLHDLDLRDLDVGTDGKIIYVLCDKEEDIEAVLETIGHAAPHSQVIFAVPTRPVSLRESAMEVASLERMQLDQNLLGRDPLVAAELQQMLDDSRAHVGRLLRQVISPAADEMRWYYDADEIEIRTASDLRRKMSDIFRNVFSKTPIFNNEMIVRQKPSPNIVNSRKKLVLGILERYGQERLGLEGEFADASMFRTLLFNTGLYKQDKSKRWRFVQPDELVDDNLSDIWAKFAELLTTPDKAPKDVTKFIRDLQSPPYGVRLGVIPILFAAALKAFPSAISLVRTNGEYVADILPSEIEELCKSPHSFQLAVLPIGPEEEEYLRKITACFDRKYEPRAASVDLIRECYDAIELWKHTSPPGALNSRLVSADAQKLQMQLRRTLAPTDLLFKILPRIAGTKDLEKVTERISNLQSELADIVDIYRSRVARSVQTILGGGAADGTTAVWKIAAEWANCFPQEFVRELDDGNCRALLNLLQGAFVDDGTFLDKLATLVAGKAPGRWDDPVVLEFERQLQDMVNRIENHALERSQSSDEDYGELGIASLLERRIDSLVLRLEQVVGEETARNRIISSLNQRATEKEEASGNTTRSAG